jgi:serine/threonine protein phosphatase PrpC
MGTDDERVRAKRPPRVPRAVEEDTPEHAAPESDTEAAEHADTAANGARPAEDVVPVLTGAPAAPPTPSAAATGVVTLADGLPWPLPPATVVGGRYRVAALTSAAPTQADENIYRVTDLRGYECCWSCGATTTTTDGTPSTTPERFCQQCGADMLSREYVMRERIDQGTDARATDVAAHDAEGALGQQRLQSPSRAPAFQSREGAPTHATTNELDTSASTAGQQGDTTVDATPTAPRAAVIAPRAGAQAADHAVDAAEHVFRQDMRVFRVSLARDETLFPVGARVEVAAATDIGLGRSSGHNEDSVGFVVMQTAHDSIVEPLALCIVADGLGGHASGKEASRIVVRSVLDHVLRQVALPVIGSAADAPSSEEALKRVLREAVAAANVALVAANAERDLDMGSTVVAALIYQQTAYIANAGDSRAYALDGGALRRLTTDHSLVEQLIAGGMITPEQRYTHPQRNQIFRSLGVGANQDVDVFTQQLRPGMRLLLCSDGLWEMVRDDALERVLRTTDDPQTACDTLVRTANEHGGEDNISALVVEVGG